MRDDRVERLLGWSRGEPQGPYQIEFHPTNLCNMDCVMCGTMTVFRDLEASQRGFRRAVSRQWEMPDERLFRLVDEAAGLGVRRWLITGGGEPMMRRSATLGMVRRIKKRGMYGNLNTNGTLFTEKDIRLFIEAGWDMVMFSIDSHIPKVHDSIRRLPGGFRLAERTMRSFKLLKSRLGTDLPKLTFNTVLTNRNYDRLDSILELCAEVDGTDVTFIPLIDFKPAFEMDLRLSDAQLEELRSLIPAAKRLSKELGVHTNIDTIVPEKIEDTTSMDRVILQDSENLGEDSFSSLPCYEPFLNLVIRMTGAVGPCCMLEDRGVRVDTQILSKVWYGDYMGSLREAMKERRLFGACRNCVYMQMMQNAEMREGLRKQEVNRRAV